LNATASCEYPSVLWSPPSGWSCTWCARLTSGFVVRRIPPSRPPPLWAHLPQSAGLPVDYHSALAPLIAPIAFDLDGLDNPIDPPTPAQRHPLGRSLPGLVYSLRTSCTRPTSSFSAISALDPAPRASLYSAVGTNTGRASLHGPTFLSGAFRVSLVRSLIGCAILSQSPRSLPGLWPFAAVPTLGRPPSAGHHSPLWHPRRKRPSGVPPQHSGRHVFRPASRPTFPCHRRHTTLVIELSACSRTRAFKRPLRGITSGEFLPTRLAPHCAFRGEHAYLSGCRVMPRDNGRSSQHFGP
jgi:hypothetical protein